MAATSAKSACICHLSSVHNTMCGIALLVSLNYPAAGIKLFNPIMACIIEMQRGKLEELLGGGKGGKHIQKLELWILRVLNFRHKECW